MKRNKFHKNNIRAYFRHYTDERLAGLLAHARDGKLAFVSCCCFIGAANADHALQAYTDAYNDNDSHYLYARENFGGAEAAEASYRDLEPLYGDDTVRRRILIPMIRAEMKRRSAAQSTAGFLEVQEEVVCS